MRCQLSMQPYRAVIFISFIYLYCLVISRISSWGLIFVSLWLSIIVGATVVSLKLKLVDSVCNWSFGTCRVSHPYITHPFSIIFYLKTKQQRKTVWQLLGSKMLSMDHLLPQPRSPELLYFFPSLTSECEVRWIMLVRFLSLWQIK